jgi:hypothetical protein
VGIQVQGFVDAAFERLLHDEIERAQVVDAVAAYRALEQGREGGLEALGGELRLDRRIVALVGDRALGRYPLMRLDAAQTLSRRAAPPLARVRVRLRGPGSLPR